MEKQKGWHKFKAKPTEIDGEKFSSKKEARYYAELLIRQKVGEVVFFLRQVPFHLPGGVKYVVDFVEFLADGTCDFVEVKGFETPEWKIKKKMVEDIYPVKIKVV